MEFKQASIGDEPDAVDRLAVAVDDVLAAALVVVDEALDAVGELDGGDRRRSWKGGASDAGLKDDRLKAGAEVKLVIAGNNKTAREVHLPVRKKDK